MLQSAPSHLRESGNASARRNDFNFSGPRTHMATRSRSRTASLPLQKTFWIVNPKITGTASKIAMIRKWLIAEATLDKRRLNALP